VPTDCPSGERRYIGVAANRRDDFGHVVSTRGGGEQQWRSSLKNSVGQMMCVGAAVSTEEWLGLAQCRRDSHGSARG
jgi:hypothetical protein